MLASSTTALLRMMSSGRFRSVGSGSKTCLAANGLKPLWRPAARRCSLAGAISPSSDNDAEQDTGSDRTFYNAEFDHCHRIAKQRSRPWQPKASMDGLQ